jgi:hypothetical protein
MKIFARSSFYDIELDVPHLQFGPEVKLGSQDEKSLRDMVCDLLFNYTKGNPIYSYIKSQCPKAGKLTQMCYKANPSDSKKDQRDEENFWLFTQMYEQILPIGFC